VPNETATCPLCGGLVLSKCGQVVAWHWAHVSGSDCDSWSDGETEWHRGWKSIASEIDQDAVEKSIWLEDRECHRADIQLKNGMVIELQHSYISPEQIYEREEFYGKESLRCGGWDTMAWLFDAREARKAGRIVIRDRGDFLTFRWKHGRKTISYCNGIVYLDLGDCVFQVKKFYAEGRCAGWGTAMTVEHFANLIRKGLQ
jgi:hypothetical protein